MPYRLIQLLIASLMLASCSVFVPEDSGPNYGKTLADLEEVEIPEEQFPVPLASIDTIEDSYRSALSVARDPSVRHRILTRLADLQMTRSEQRQLSATEEQDYFADAIDMYQELLVLNSERQGEEGTPTNERLLYQLSKAYALDGRIQESDEILASLVTDFPESAFAAEADFRRAEKAFSDGDYKTAEDLYAKVMAAGDDTPFYLNAVYMHGWSLFKRNRYRASIRSFTEVLDRNLAKDIRFEELSNSQRNVSVDTMRVLSIAFSYLDGAQTITDVYSKLGQRHYQHMLYMGLGDLYLEKRRFRDSADTYRHYVQNFPNTDPAPSFSIKAIEVYDLGGFPSLILPAKEEYITNYGIYSQYWKDRDDEKRADIKPKLAVYLDELSSYYHARAIELEKFNKKYEADKAAGRKVKEKPEPARKDFLKAAALYEEFVLTFPKTTKTPEMAYLMGEAFYSAGELPRAITAYETVAYNYLDKQRGAEAGYSAIVALQEMIDRTAQDPNKETENLTWRTHKIESSISFADYYPGDSRAAPVLTKAAQEIFEKNEYQRAADLAERLTKWQPRQDEKLVKSAWLILAHSRFDLQQYAEAEFAYKQLLSIMPDKDEDRPQVVERIAASIYRQAELQVNTGELAPAVDRLLSLHDVAPGSEIAIKGQYDAANHLIELKDWAKAEQVLLSFQSRYPKHELISTLPPKFALVYQESEQWDKAAQALETMATTDKTGEGRRQALYLSGELYEKSGRIPKAIEKYSEYANRYPQPFDIATEARFHLVELYGKTKDEGKRNFWLKKLIESDAKAGASRTDRSKYLAAFATSKFANDEYARYEKIKLTLPLKKSLKKKRAALDVTLAEYRKVLQFGVAEFATEANHRIGNIYSQLSRDLMDSQRPAGMDALALEQYEILLEEQALPFEEKAIDILASNAERAWTGIYDDWVKESFKSLAEILPARYGKQERSVEFSDAIF
ncbi:tetratricopeptide repeat protein [Agarilytica rhodophyticola]|uniref:tetratricopeptide repeat protein n=1 Tax=Agarilytica rhodophyticola TaxID=1737490 RepID=UPI001FE47CEF|nr:tetratricopeptide repeat protein [Agarilytica rhodophyticola]